jgi:hypothetical protein
MLRGELLECSRLCDRPDRQENQTGSYLYQQLMSMTAQIECTGISFGLAKLSRHTNLLKRPDRIWTHCQVRRYFSVVRSFLQRSLTT